MSVPKWDEARTNKLVDFVGDESPVSVATIEEAADLLETSTRSVGSKLRKLGYETQKASTAARKTFTDDEAETLQKFLEANPNEHTFEEIASHFAGGKFTSKQIQGKILSMELNDLVKPAEKKEYVRTYSEDEEAAIIKACKAGEAIEDIASGLNRDVNSVRGKALSLLRTGQIDSMPKSNSVKKTADVFDGLDNISDMTVAEIAEAVDRSERGVKTMLTRRGITVSDWDGAGRREKNLEKAAG